MRPSTLRALIGALFLSAPLSAQLPPPPAPPGNPLTPEKAVLGKILFWEEQLSSDNTTACGTCHIPSAGGSERRIGPEASHPGFDGLFGTPDDIAGSPGVIRSDAADDYRPDAIFGFERQVTPRWTPTALAAAYFGLLFWDGRASGIFVDPQTGQTVLFAGGALESQAIGPPLSDVEMAHEARDWDEIVAKLASAEPLALASALPPDVATALGLAPTFPELFQRAFGDPTLSAARIALAIASYERSLVPNQTPWDAAQAGNPAALTPAQQQGFNLMVASSCIACHTPPLFSNGTFRNIGLRPVAEDRGRQEVTSLFADRGRFKVPTLRNAGLRARFMHTGEFQTLAQVVLFYNGGGAFPDNRDPLIRPLGLAPPQRANIADFIANGLTDPRVAAELFPFDRPRLASEAPTPNPRLVGTPVAGSGGLAPRMIALSPPKLGAEGFKLGLASGLGGALAYLVIGRAGELDASFPLAGRPRALWIQTVVELEGRGPGGGFATVQLGPEALPGWSFPTVQAQWWVRDPQAEGGFARSAVAELEVF